MMNAFRTLPFLVLVACGNAPLPPSPDGAGGVLTGAGGAGEGGTASQLDCPPGEVRSCWCPQGYTSTQVCNDDGVTIGACDCSDECAVDADCKPELCHPAACVNGACQRITLPVGTVVLTDPPGDCAVMVCTRYESPFDDIIYAAHAIDPSDAPIDGNTCTLDLCVDGWPENPLLPMGTPCPGGQCDGAGLCK